MTQLQEILAVAAVIALAGIALLVGLVRSRGHGGTKSIPGQMPSTRAGSGAGSESDSGSDAGESLAGPTGGTSVDTLEPGDLQATSPAPSIEHPESAVGRLQRLRARLARSNTAFGKGLLSLLSSGGLDEQSWEDVEDTLLSSDLGVEATMELVDSLRTRVKVEGARDEETVRGWLREDLLQHFDGSLDASGGFHRAGRPWVTR